MHFLITLYRGLDEVTPQAVEETGLHSSIVVITPTTKPSH